MGDSISGLTGTGGGNMMRVIGMASGLDIDGMVKKMLLADQTKINKVKQDKQIISWKQEFYQDIIKDVKELQNKYFSATSEDSLISSKNYSDFKIESSDKTVATATATGAVVEGNYNIEVLQLAKGAAYDCDIKGTMDTKLSKEGTITIKQGEKTAKINYNEGDSIKDLVNNIKNSKWEDGTAVGNDLKVSYSELTEKFTIETKKTGEDIDLQINGLDFKEKHKSQSAEFNITAPDGSLVKGIKKDKNNFSIDGINYNLICEGNTSLTIAKDVDKTFDRIKGFIDKYNGLLENINGKLSEKKNYSYKPLTEEQKKEMKDDEIKVWEEKAKKGILRNDDRLQKMLSELRGCFFQEVPDAGISFGRTDMGLDTADSSKDIKKSGQIVFTANGEEKLKEALREKPEEVMKLFNTSYKLTDEDKKLLKEEQKKKVYNNSGISQRINNILKDYVGLAGTTLNNSILTEFANKQEDYSLKGSGGANNLPDQMYRKDILIKELNTKMKKRENTLYNQFSRLEVIMNKYNSQAGWLAQQFGGQ
ncbi:flagellar filament capping protein FliD [Clostridium rectalis]|uniref:flagellar filament capping protein FliD n=1 Tax=Clostridium rectalis TaxID=2040295 RepID=UPI000F635B6B|nr:flagellar filament capping protein FliD [Clostridium rectalis]